MIKSHRLTTLVYIVGINDQSDDDQCGEKIVDNDSENLQGAGNFCILVSMK
jgi:hypothetical protein